MRTIYFLVSLLALSSFICFAGRIDEGAMRERRRRYNRCMRSVNSVAHEKLTSLSVFELGDELAEIAHFLYEIDRDRSLSKDKRMAYLYTVTYELYKKCYDVIRQYLSDVSDLDGDDKKNE